VGSRAIAVPCGLCICRSVVLIPTTGSDDAIVRKLAADRVIQIDRHVAEDAIRRPIIVPRKFVLQIIIRQVGVAEGDHVILPDPRIIHHVSNGNVSERAGVVCHALTVSGDLSAVKSGAGVVCDTGHLRCAAGLVSVRFFSFLPLQDSCQLCRAGSGRLARKLQDPCR